MTHFAGFEESVKLPLRLGPHLDAACEALRTGVALEDGMLALAWARPWL